MPSSTSSSNQRAPQISYSLLWTLSLLFLALAIGATEWRMRHHNYRASVADSERLWSLIRSDAYADSKREGLIIAGSSRAQLGLEPSVLEEYLPHYKVKQLALSGMPAMDIVSDLCHDPEFDGVILWSAAIRTLVPHGLPRKDTTYTHFYRHQFTSPGATERNLNCLIRAFLQQHVACMVSGMQPRKLIRRHFQVPRNHAAMRIDRTRPAFFREKMSSDRLHSLRAMRVRTRLARPTEPSTEELIQFAQGELAEMNQALRSHGGRMILLRCPHRVSTGRPTTDMPRVPPSGTCWRHTVASPRCTSRTTRASGGSTAPTPPTWMRRTPPASHAI